MCVSFQGSDDDADNSQELVDNDDNNDKDIDDDEKDEGYEEGDNEDEADEDDVIKPNHGRFAKNCTGFPNLQKYLYALHSKSKNNSYYLIRQN